MAKAGQRKCMSCGEFFIPDHRSGERQRYCCAADCRHASKAASQAAWLARPPNNDYFSCTEHSLDWSAKSATTVWPCRV